MTPTAMAEPICTPSETEYDDAAELDGNLPEEDADGFGIEYVNDVRMEMAPMSSISIRIASLMLRLIDSHAEQHQLGVAFAEMRFRLRETPKFHRQPDVAFLSFARWPRDQPFPDTDPCPAVPDLTVEVVSPNDKAYDIMDRIAEYFAAGVRAVWVVYPRHRQVHVWEAPAAVRVLSGDASLTGEPVLPGFAVGLPRLFASAAPAPVFG